MLGKNKYLHTRHRELPQKHLDLGMVLQLPQYFHKSRMLVAPKPEIYSILILSIRACHGTLDSMLENNILKAFLNLHSEVPALQQHNQYCYQKTYCFVR